MPTTRTTEPSVEPFDLAEAKAHLRVDDDAEDDLIEALITTVRQACEDRIERTLITSTWLYEADYMNVRMRLPMGPVQSVASVQYLDTDGVLQTLADTEWQFTAGILMPAHNKVWPLRICQPGAARITYTAGYGDAASAVPKPYIAWMKLALTDLFENRGASAERPAVPQNFAESLLTNRLSWLP
jgi:uncharacterized phiE125 gp8 family phage protein